MKPIKVWDKIHKEEKEVALVNYVEGYVLVWTGNKRARSTVRRWFDDVEELGDIHDTN